VLPVAGDDEAAKRSVTGFLDWIGYDAYDVGPLSEGWRYQRDTAAYVQPYTLPGSRYPTWPGRQATSEMLREKLDAAVRYRDM
jgi:8-hydroxy-5-deazaflavin:NADPH oxidoreductase